MNWDVFITCAVTGAGNTAGISDKVPVTPEQIADATIKAAKAGAAIAHIHVRDPETGAPARDPVLYRRVVERVRASDTDVILNLTAGMGGDIVFGSAENPFPWIQQGRIWWVRRSGSPMWRLYARKSAPLTAAP